ncbi:DUF342 domain-containing protein [Aminipila terrae]|uniref:DUF342 domain-containing protein n=1 Tax=Aminipila terrae TaxID=2697030 RepID=A0A6P1MDE0_9FIRM|nr:FapA family protein [Aminipila terrae]QHI71927.1 DUF342 domain-containing protein [Aminipila terrae]
MSRMPHTTKEIKSEMEQKADKFYHKAMEMFTHNVEKQDVQKESADSGPDDFEEHTIVDHIDFDSGVNSDEEIISGMAELDEYEDHQESDELDELDEVDDYDEIDELDELDGLLNQKDVAAGFDSADDILENKSVTFTLFFSADKMNAYIRAQDYKYGSDADNRVPSNVIYELLKEKGVVYGIDDAGIVEYCTGKKLYKDFQVATGTRPQKGEDGSVEYLFSIEPNHGPKEKDDGTVDYKELDLIHNVNSGDILCRVTPPTNGTDGMDVLGGKVNATPGKPAAVSYGKGVRVSEDGLEYIAIDNGMVELNNGTVEVKEVYTVNGDVGPATGNIRFNGSVVVKGSVLSDFAIYANGDIIINGYVEASILNTTGDIIIKNGISGMKKGLLKADGSVTVRFAEMARIVAGGNFYCDYCINCDVRVGDSIIGKGKRASLLGGNYIAGTKIDVNVIGSGLNIPMDVQIIPNWQEIRNFKSKPEERIRENKELMSQFEKSFTNLKHKYSHLDLEINRAARKNSMDTQEVIDAKQKKVVLLMKQKSNIKRQMAEIDERRDKINRMIACEGCMVIGRKTVHISVRITIGNAMLWVNDPMDHQTFTENNGIIEAHSITPGSI